ncbi:MULTISPECIES: hypothetical protein [Herbiconiux]|jgi:predicted phage-related endonuclease|uniref:Putative phage-related endonuclease n=1 Tax=Herbiconiux flava TaxID=881268 RepID=A0A852SQ40_9MICO|nr:MULTISPECIES: hypothetical protein [Herbiconiux]MBF4573105.1 hypothetical protein [Herbiconiux sp. VKM Ac-1786]NQX33228.1 hypothetical protein [Herbiconiux sp. VKM Ac-2851]NYD70926.1 putative phage-related endonuclease [Herbiconiux flava]GLK19112.1 hypothetical protein GCM10017602_35940 [Herbiconiux flava]
MKKILVIVAFAAGYVVGARAGRRRYEQIRDKAQQLWHDDHVQSAVQSAGDAVEQVAGKAADKAGDLIGKVRSH